MIQPSTESRVTMFVPAWKAGCLSGSLFVLYLEGVTGDVFIFNVLLPPTVNN